MTPRDCNCSVGKVACVDHYVWVKLQQRENTVADATTHFQHLMATHRYFRKFTVKIMSILEEFIGVALVKMLPVFAGIALELFH